MTVALINTNLRGEALAHSLNTGRAALRDQQRTARAGALGCGARTARPRGCSAGCSARARTTLPRLDLAIAAVAGGGRARTAAAIRAPTLADRALCIYTSGTTGLPKAANVSHYRLMQWSHWFAGLIDVQPSDRMYNCLPHVPQRRRRGGDAGATLVGGGAVVLRERFSASAFWQDVVRGALHAVSVHRRAVPLPAQHALAQPGETQHALRLACGNGLRGGSLGASSSSASAFRRSSSTTPRPRATFRSTTARAAPAPIGRIPPFLSHRVPVALVKFDVEAALPVRDAAGRCVRCAAQRGGRGDRPDHG